MNDGDELIPPSVLCGSCQWEFWETEKWGFGKIRPICRSGAGWIWREHWRGARRRAGDSSLYFSATRSDLCREQLLESVVSTGETRLTQISRPKLWENTWTAVTWLTSSLWIIILIKLSRHGKIWACSGVVVAAEHVCTILCPETNHDITAVM